MRISQEVGQKQVAMEYTGGFAGGWFQIAETMGRTRGEDDALTGRRRSAEGQSSAVSRRRPETTDFSDVRLERVLELRAAIANGTYRVSAADIADRMLGRLLGGRLASGRN